MPSLRILIIAMLSGMVSSLIMNHHYGAAVVAGIVGLFWLGVDFWIEFRR